MRIRNKITGQLVNGDRWVKNGDMPADFEGMILPTGRILPEGRIVRYYRNPEIDGQKVCEKCEHVMQLHGWIDDARNNSKDYTVCPGDWIITTPEGYVTMHPTEIDENYEIIEEPAEGEPDSVEWTDPIEKF